MYIENGMSKKLLYMLVIFMITLGLSACSSTDVEQEESSQTENNEEEVSTNDEIEQEEAINSDSNDEGSFEEELEVLDESFEEETEVSDLI